MITQIRPSQAEKQRWSDVQLSRDTGVSRHQEGQIGGPLKPYRPSETYRIEGFKVGPHYNERLASFGIKGVQFRGPLKPLRPSQSYRIEAFKVGP